MIEREVFDVLVKLGVAAPLILILWKLMNDQSKERREMTERHISVIERVNQTATDALAKNTSALDRLSEAVREGRHQSTTEHMELLRALQDSRREEK